MIRLIRSKILKKKKEWSDKRVDCRYNIMRNMPFYLLKRDLFELFAFLGK